MAATIPFAGEHVFGTKRYLAGRAPRRIGPGVSPTGEGRNVSGHAACARGRSIHHAQQPRIGADPHHVRFPHQDP